MTTDLQERLYRHTCAGTAHLLDSATQEISAQVQILQAASAPEIAVLNQQQDFELERNQELSDQVRVLRSRVQPPQSVVAALCSLLVFACSTLAATVFLIWTVEPFGLGLRSVAYCVAIGLAVPYSLDYFLETFRSRVVHKTIVAGTAVLALSTTFVFGVLRADLLARSLNQEPAVVIEDSDVSTPVATDRGANELLDTLRRANVFGALALESVGALALCRFRKGRGGVSFRQLMVAERARVKSDQKLLEITRRRHALLAGPRRLEAELWSATQRGLREGMRPRPSLRRLGLMLVATIALGVGQAHAAEKVHLLIALDLTKTERAVGYGGKSEFDQNVKTVSSILGQLPISTRLTIFGITNQTHANPAILLSARIGDDPGLFSSKLLRARRDLVAAWSKQVATLQPNYQHTDILGGFALSSEAFSESSSARRILIFLSDMRNDVGLDLETPLKIDAQKSLEYLNKQNLIVTLADVEVLVAGAGEHAGKRDMGYSLGLKQFWTEYIRRSGAKLKTFSTTRDVQAMTDLVSLRP